MTMKKQLLARIARLKIELDRERRLNDLLRQAVELLESDAPGSAHSDQ